MTNERTYKVIFHNQGKVYQLYAQHVYQDAMFGFVTVEKLIFGDRNSVVVDPTEETLKNEFAGVERSYIPMHAIIRIDNVKKKGVAKITEGTATEGNIMPFPVYTKSDSSNQ